ncbi:MAG TPA: hemolysin family protein [Thermoanaerobaculia bacterium]
MPDGLAGGWTGEAWAFAWAAAALAVVTVVASTLSALIERSGPIRLRHWAEEAEGRLLALYEDPIRFDAFRLLLSTAAKLAPVALFGSLAALARAVDAGAPAAWPLGAALLVVAVVVATEVLNRVLVGRDPEAALERLTGTYRALLVAGRPLVAATVALLPSRALLRRVEDEEDDDEISDEEIEAFIDVGTQEGILEPGEEELLRGIVDFGDTAVRSVMTPRIQVECAPVGADLEALADRFVASGHSRLPLFEGSIDHIVGILHIRDLLKALRTPPAERPTARSLANPPFFVPETKPLGQLLKELQARFQQMAVVVDEYGGTAGIVTVEDLVEEIVGELADEHEEAQAENQLLPGGGWILDGGSEVEILEELFGIDLGEDVPWETVGGMVFSLLGDVPSGGETVESHGLRYMVVDVEERRVARVRVEPVAPLPGGDGGPGGGPEEGSGEGPEGRGERRREAEDRAAGEGPP